MKKSKKRVVVISAKTGGGHRAAALAIIEQLNKNKSLEVIHFDVMEDAPRPIRDIPKMYSSLTKLRTTYSTVFKLTEGSRQSQFTIDAVAKRYGKIIRQHIEDLNPDVIISCHFGANTFLPTLHTLAHHIPFLTVVTDLETGHPMWFDKRADMVILPSVESYARARNFGMPAKKLKIIGLPISAKFAEQKISKQALRQDLGWPTDKPTLLVMAGGDGLGKINSLTKQLDKINSDVHLAIIAGRNKSLYENLKSRKFTKSVHIYEFVENIPQMMQASDVLLTKAGPGTIVEAIVSRLPIVIFDFLPGQEEGNLHYVVDNKAGLWASTNSLAIRGTEDILSGYAKIGGARYEKIRRQHLEAAANIAKYAVDFPAEKHN